MSASSGPASWMHDVRPGHRLRVDPYWNATSGPSNRLTDLVEVVEVISPARSQTGVMFVLRFTGADGEPVVLDAAWFLGPERELPG